ncbi:MAG: hypothetical protein RMY29_000760 [Nostoc sp. CreGUA01]|nr:hypothetical protein [Nostoc sp. CreGUA01]
MPTTSGKPLLELATAYNSLRDSGFDFSTAVGEPIDNAIQAQATKIYILIKTIEKDNPNSKKKVTCYTASSYYRQRLWYER